jgi:hypothetical protein
VPQRSSKSFAPEPTALAAGNSSRRWIVVAAVWDFSVTVAERSVVVIADELAASEPLQPRANEASPPAASSVMINLVRTAHFLRLPRQATSVSQRRSQTLGVGQEDRRELIDVFFGSASSP